MMEPEASLSAVEWAVAGRPFPGEAESGDLHVLLPYAGGVLAGVIDGLGHGPAAAAASQRAAEALAEAPGAPVRQQIERCHAAMRGSRGAVMTLAALDLRSDQMTWSAVGNVEAALYRGGLAPARETIVPRNGVVGYQLPPLRETTLPIGVGDVLVLATDGIGHDFVLGAPSRSPAQDYAREVLDRYATGGDDALVLVLRYLGSPR
jgi:serine phosphatase RsbU (regulator of sigma subunit)